MALPGPAAAMTENQTTGIREPDGKGFGTQEEPFRLRAARKRGEGGAQVLRTHLRRSAGTGDLLGEPEDVPACMAHGRNAQASISTRAPSGSAATWTVDRAGGSDGKNSA